MHFSGAFHFFDTNPSTPCLHSVPEPEKIHDASRVDLRRLVDCVNRCDALAVQGGSDVVVDDE